MAVEPHLRGLAGWIDEQAARVLEVGSTCAPLGDATWDALLREHGVAPLPNDERQKHLAEGPKRKGGALPIEVRWVISAIHDRAYQACRAMDMKTETDVENDLVRKIEHRLHVLVDEITHEHLKRIAPSAPTTSSIFANARATTPQYGGGMKAGMSQMKCTACGAPRKTEDPSVGPCVYCGGEMK